MLRKVMSQQMKMTVSEKTQLLHTLPERCKTKYEELHNTIIKIDKMQSDADAYLKKTGPRDIEWERQFVAEFLSAVTQVEEISATKFELDTLHSVVHDDVPRYWDIKKADSTLSVWKVVRLYASKNGLPEEIAAVGSVKDVTAESTAPQITTSIATPAPAPVVKTEEKKSGEDKTVEKGKDESGVEGR
jgi:hypothetical protein